MHARAGFTGNGRDTGAEARSRSAELAPSGLIVLALVALLLVPFLLQRQVRHIRDEIQNAADPARTEVTRIQYLLARQTSSLRGFFISGDSAFLDQYRQLAAREREAQALLDTLSRRLGANVVAHAVEMRTRSAQWHEEVEEQLGIGPSFDDGLPYEWNLYLDVLAVASRLDEAVAQATQERRLQIEAAERRAQWTQVALAMLALAAALAVARLNQRMRGLAAEAEVRRKEAEQALAETARAVESKARLIRGVTHDVKNPLGAADGYAELLLLGLRGELTPDQVQMVSGIRRSIHGALHIIQDLLDLSRAEAGDLPVERRPVPLRRLVQEVVDEYRGMADARGHALELRLDAEEPIVLTDQARVRQILGNLLGNAVKYTPRQGCIGVAVRTEPNGSAKGPDRWAVVRISDNGPGIPPADRERIFQEFQRLSEATVMGHGLGLTISRRIARLLGGDITVESKVGEGSTFVLWLPAGEPGEE